MDQLKRTNLFQIVIKENANIHKLSRSRRSDQNQRITNHYYLIDAVKNNDLNYIKSYFSDKYNNVNESLKLDTNTILHQAVYDEMNEIVSYLITHNGVGVNKDGWFTSHCLF